VEAIVTGQFLYQLHDVGHQNHLATPAVACDGYHQAATTRGPTLATFFSLFYFLLAFQKHLLVFVFQNFTTQICITHKTYFSSNMAPSKHFSFFF
jgi:hypothetical protein